MPSTHRFTVQERDVQSRMPTRPVQLFHTSKLPSIRMECDQGASNQKHGARIDATCMLYSAATASWYEIMQDTMPSYKAKSASTCYIGEEHLRAFERTPLRSLNCPRCLHGLLHQIMPTAAVNSFMIEGPLILIKDTWSANESILKDVPR